jgi:hypothetical protein
MINPPGFWLGHHFRTHDGLRCEQAQEAELGDPAETEMRVLTQAGKPTSGDDVVEMPLGGEGDPDVDVREKE